jgi:hypothetical protein
LHWIMIYFQRTLPTRGIQEVWTKSGPDALAAAPSPEVTAKEHKPLESQHPP